MAPRQIIPGSTYLVTRRCSQRQFLLLPSKTVNRVFLYCLAVAAARFGMKIHAVCCLGNHYHIVLTDPKGNIARFSHLLNLLVGRALNCFYGRGESFFASSGPSYVRLVDHQDVLDKIVYTLTNPVAAGLVKKGEHWPGVHTSVNDFGKVIVAEKPKIFFAPGGSLPESATFEVVQPAGYEHWERRRFVRTLSSAVERRESEIQERMRAEGRKFAGPRKVKQQSPFGMPASPRGFGKMCPRVACKDKWRRIEVLGQLTAFLADYRVALAEYLAGKRRVEFPAGTYLMRLRHGVKCRRSRSARVLPAPA
jgi:REP element-mobilizing transposase RayT